MILPEKGCLGLQRLERRLLAEDGLENHDMAMRCIAEYEKFFLLAARHRYTSFVPSRRVDLVWQRHMLDTLAYAEDCACWAGGYLHRVESIPPGAYEQTLAFVGPYDPHLWDQPGAACMTLDPVDSITPVKRLGRLDKEDFLGVLARVRSSLQHKPSAPAWVLDARTLLETDPTIAIEEYRRFLVLLTTEVGPLTPSKLVDEFWHQHILDSRHYTDFCSRIAGRYLHHIPHYEKQHGFHAPAFRRTQALYEKRFGLNPPSRVWSHMGESGGVVACSSEPDPLYIIDQPGEMCAELSIGRVDLRHFKTFHPILANNRLPIQLWLELIHEVNAVSQLSWPQFSAIGSNSPLLWGTIVGLLAIAQNWYPFLRFVGFLGVAMYYARWKGRDFDPVRASEIVSDYNLLFVPYGAELSLYRNGKSIYLSARSLSDGLATVA